MWSRADLKYRAKASLRRNYWRCVVIALVLTLFVSEYEWDRFHKDDSDSNTENVTNGASDGMWGSESRVELNNGSLEVHVTEDTVIWVPFLNFFSGLGALGKMIGKVVLTTVKNVLLLGLALGFLAFSIFISSPLEIGGCRFFLDNAYTSPQVWVLLSAFAGKYYLKTVWIQFCRRLYTFLWGLLLVVPGIVKSYEYCMIPYLLADFPDLRGDEAFQISREMMEGNKWDTFVLDLSFLLWDYLSSITFGLVGLFFVNPYRYATKAELYLTLKAGYFHRA